VHTRVANLRADGLHQLTTALTREFGVVVLEDLNVAGMVRNHRLARHISDASFGEFRRQVTYKMGWNGATLLLAERWFASSKTCSDCGAVKTKLALKVRVFDCDECPLVLDRDENAARNLAALAAEYLAQMCSTGTAVGGSLTETPVSVNARGAGRKTRRYHPDQSIGRGGRAGGVSPRKRKETSTAPSSTRKTACNGRSTENPVNGPSCDRSQRSEQTLRRQDCR
jgi:putative transposase